VERPIGWLKENRRIASQFDKSIDSDIAMVHIETAGMIMDLTPKSKHGLAASDPGEAVVPLDGVYSTCFSSTADSPSTASHNSTIGFR